MEKDKLNEIKKTIKAAHTANKKELKKARKYYEEENLEEEDTDYEEGYNDALEFVMDTLGIKYKSLYEE